jgi:hypothetical protein
MAPNRNSTKSRTVRRGSSLAGHVLDVMYDPRLSSDRGNVVPDPAMTSDATRCAVCRHDGHGDRACPKPYCLCDGDAP